MYAFNYQKPGSISDAVAAASGSEDSRYLAGGQSLVQAMRLRLASASDLIELSSISELRGITDDDKTLTIGAMTTHAEVAKNATVLARLPALASLAGGIGDPMVRNMGTLGGSLANADPAACYPAAVLALDATIITDRREIVGTEFFQGLFETSLEPGELIRAVRFRVPTHAAYEKFKQQASRFALVGVMVAKFDDGVRVGVTGAKATAFRSDEIEKALTENFASAALDTIQLSADDMNADLHGSAAYRAAMVGVMAKRAVDKALAN